MHTNLQTATIPDHTRREAANDARVWLQQHLELTRNDAIVTSLALLLVHQQQVGFERACQAVRRINRDWPQSRGDNGLTLSLRLANERLEEAERVVARVMRAFDRDEDAGGSFEIVHDPSCPAARIPCQADRCACGLYRTTSDLKDAVMDLEQARLALRRIFRDEAAPIGGPFGKAGW